MQSLTDAELMELVKQGDFSAFDELYTRYNNSIRRFLYSLTWDEDTAEDYLQEVFYRLYRARSRYQPTGKFSTYLFQIAKNFYLAQCRKQRKAQPEVSFSQEDRNGFRPFENIRANARVEPEVHLMEEYQRFQLRRAINTLPDHQRLVFVMSHFEEMKYTEIAEVLDIPVGTVKSRMSKATNRLKALLGRNNHEL